jgi:hypothetical protein
MADVISSFRGEFAFLSNFEACDIYYENIMYPSVEHAFQATKTTNEGERLAIANAATPGKAKQMGRAVTLRADWEEVKDSIMDQLLALKFGQGLRRAQLFSTGDRVLIEQNFWHDQYWGCCYCPKHKDIPGRNQLGVALMNLRARLAASR